MKLYFILGMLVALSAIVLFSGCVSNAQDTNDENTFSMQQNQYQNYNEMQNQAEQQLEDLENNEQIQDMMEKADTLENHSESIQYCIIDYENGETQEFWFAKNNARMYTKYKTAFIDSVIDRTQNCSKDSEGRHSCAPLEESFESIVEGWKVAGQMLGKCNTKEFDASIFAIEE